VVLAVMTYVLVGWLEAGTRPAAMDFRRS
jgi:hypothetical protein